MILALFRHRVVEYPMNSTAQSTDPNPILATCRLPGTADSRNPLMSCKPLPIIRRVVDAATYTSSPVFSGDRLAPAKKFQDWDGEQIRANIGVRANFSNGG